MAGKELKYLYPSETALRKQDLFWESIIRKYENAIKDLEEEQEIMQQRVDEINLLTQAIVAFNVSKLVKEKGSLQSANQLLNLDCHCPDFREHEPLYIPQLRQVFSIDQMDILQMRTIRELSQHEAFLLDEVNKLRVKDATIVQFKQNLDRLMFCNFGKTGEIIDTTNQIGDIEELMQMNRSLREQLMNYKENNQKWFENLEGPLKRELNRLRMSKECIMAEMQELERQHIETVENEEEIQNLLLDVQSLRSVMFDLTGLVQILQTEANIRNKSIQAMYKISGCST